jgi:nucleotide-binding universal stress UspA family protein
VTVIDEVVVPVDGSSRSLAALPVAAAVARQVGGRVTVVRICPPRLDCGPALRWLDEVAAPWGARTVAVVADHPADALLELAEEEATSVLCMTSHGRSVAGELALGSVSAEIVRRSPSPVLLVGRRAAAPASFSDLEVCVHGPPSQVAPTAARWAAALHATAWLVAVQGPDELLSQDSPAGAELAAVDAALRHDGIHTEVRLLHADDVAAELVVHAAAVGADLLVAATESRHGLGGLVLGSVAMQLVARARQPVLLVGPHCG